MARTKKCTENDVSILLEADSDVEYEYNVPRKSRNSDNSDCEIILDNNKSVLLRKNALQREQVSLRLRLRRSTEQSSYKIDSDSDNERPKRSTRIANCSKKSQDENKMPRKGIRIIKLPKRYSDYDCSSSKSQVTVSRVNYNDEESYFASSDKKDTEVKTDVFQDDRDKSNNSDCSCVAFIPKVKSTRSNTISENNERDNVTFNQNFNQKLSGKIIETRSRMSKRTIENAEFSRDSPGKRLFNDEATANTEAMTKTVEHMSFGKSPKKRVIELVNTPLDSTPKRQTRNRRSIARNILTSPSKRESATDEYDGKENVDIEIIQKSMKDISINKQRNKDAEVYNAIESTIQDNTSTPKSRKSLKYSALTPSVKMRTGALTKPATPLQEARLRLHVSAVPKSLPCREEEFNNIYTFLESKLMDNRGGCIYISGVPGTGKTATVNEVVKCLKRSVEKGKVDQFDFVEINGMKLSEPRQAYVQILKQLSDKVLTWEQAYNVLEKRFNSNVKRPMTLLLVDELDLLCTKRQDVVYNILDWPAKISARLIVITIANTMDLPERILMGRVTSRLGLTRVSFQPYKHEQLQEIIISRLRDTKLFKSEAIQLIARKVSAVSGDARRALDICRRVAEIAETRNGDTVSMEDVNQALSEMIANPKVQAIKHCSKMEQVFLQAMCAEIVRTGVEEVCFKSVYKQFESLCSFDGLRTPNITETFGICMRLSNSRLFVCEDSSNDIHQRILLNVSKDDVHYALQQVNIK